MVVLRKKQLPFILRIKQTETHGRKLIIENYKKILVLQTYYDLPL